MCRERVWVLLASSELSIAALWLALPELALWRAGRVAVVWRWAESTLFAAVLNEAVLGEDGDEEKDTRAC